MLGLTDMGVTCIIQYIVFGSLVGGIRKCHGGQFSALVKLDAQWLGSRSRIDTSLKKSYDG